MSTDAVKSADKLYLSALLGTNLTRMIRLLLLLVAIVVKVYSKELKVPTLWVIRMGSKWFHAVEPGILKYFLKI